MLIEAIIFTITYFPALLTYYTFSRVHYLSRFPALTTCYMFSRASKLLRVPALSWNCLLYYLRPY